VSIAQLARRVAEVAGGDIGIHIDPSAQPPLTRSRYIPAVERAQSEFGLQVWVPLDEGLRRMWQWNQAQRLAAPVPQEGAAELMGTASVS
jgi:nucleoside-diphosphate-sugar epimerase